MASSPRVLVLMTTQNGQSFLAEQLDSIFAQRDVELFLLVSDDCSTDATFRILETYAAEHENMDIVYNTHERGQTIRLLDLLYSAPVEEYDFFAIADQDDVWDVDKLAAGTAHITANTSRPELYYAGVCDIDEQGTPLNHDYSRFEVCAAHTGSLLLVPNWAFGCTMLMNRALVKLLRQHRAYDFGRGCDAWIHAVALYCGGFVFCDLGHCYVDRRLTAHKLESRVHFEDWPSHDQGVSGLYTQMAHALLREYEREMDEDTAKLVEAVAVRRLSAKARRFLFGRTDIMMPTNPKTTKLRWAILGNKF